MEVLLVEGQPVGWLAGRWLADGGLTGRAPANRWLAGRRLAGGGFSSRGWLVEVWLLDMVVDRLKKRLEITAY